MKIFKGNLCFRFYPSEGWTRQLVSDMFENPDYSKVIPRFYDFEDDERIMKSLEKGFVMPENLNDGKFLDCDYFAVYNTEMTINDMKLSDHTIQYLD